MSTDNEWLRLIYAQLISNTGGGGAGGATEATLALLGREATLQTVNSFLYGIRADLSVDLQKGQKLMDSSLPVTIAVNQSPIPVTDATLARILDDSSPEYNSVVSPNFGYWRVPAGKEWQVTALRVVYTSSSAVSPRRMVVALGDIRFFCPLTQAASTVVGYNSAPTIPEYPALREQNATIPIPLLTLPSGSEIQFFMAFSHSADTFSNLCLFVNERSL